jgi:hypothetical protein
MKTYLFEAYGFVLWADFPLRTVGSPTSSGEEPVERVVVGVHPPAGTSKSVGPQSIRTGVQKPRAMTSMLRRWIHNEHLDRAVDSRVGIVILAGHRGGEPHDSLAVSRHKDAERCLRGPLNGRAPRVGHLRQ